MSDLNQPFCPTHRATYIGRHSDLVYDQVYDIQMCSHGTYFRVCASSGRILRTPVERWKNLHDLSIATGIRIDPNDPYAGSIRVKPGDPFGAGGFFDALTSGGGSEPVPEVKPNAPSYKHQNATSRANELQKDTESTKELRKYRFTPEKGYES